MASFNKIFLVGNLTKDPETKYTPQGKQVCKFGLAVKRAFTKNDEVDFFNIIAWEKLADICGQYLKKGKQILIEGRAQIRPYETNDGQKKTAIEVIAESMQMLGSKNDTGSSGSDSTSAKPKNSGYQQSSAGSKSTSRAKPRDEDLPDISDGSDYDSFDPDDMPF